MALGKPSILVSGWRFRPHSYAVVNQFQCLELLRRGVTVYFRETPFVSKKGHDIAHLFPPEQEAQLAAMRPPPDRAEIDAELRIGFPYDLLTPSPARRLFVFGTADFHSAPPWFFEPKRPLRELHAEARNVVIVTPSNWGREGFVRSGADPERVKVVPHGFDPKLYHPPTTQERAAARAMIGEAGDDVVFLNVSTMANNKGMPLLLRAFGAVLRRHPRVRLVLKGQELAYYSSMKLIRRAIGEIPDKAAAQQIASRLIYNGEHVPFADLARLYHAADCYVAPYHAECFNLPVLEAAASGLPIICTAGGPTDDFVNDAFAARIRATVIDTPADDEPKAQALSPDLENLARLMLNAIEDTQWRRRAALAGPDYVASRFTWSHAVDRLLKVMLEP
jgi:glycosyltransferase involved in cell wall biosynthesis